MGGSPVESTLRAGAGAPGLRLIETFALGSPGTSLHRARMATAAEALGWTADMSGFDAALAAARPQGGARLRLTLDRQGNFALSQSPMPPAKPLWRLGLAAETLDSGDPWLAIKSSRRPAYERAREALPGDWDEALLVNQRGEVCEGTITTLFFDRGAGMRTPPLSCGLLPGILRAQIACPEEILPAGDLPKVRLWVGNSLRGLIPALWAGAQGGFPLAPGAPAF